MLLLDSEKRRRKSLSSFFSVYHENKNIGRIASGVSVRVLHGLKTINTVGKQYLGIVWR